MPHNNTIRRVYQNMLSEAEFEQMAQEYNQQEQAGKREVLALDGKTLRGTVRVSVGTRSTTIC